MDLSALFTSIVICKSSTQSPWAYQSLCWKVELLLSVSRFDTRQVVKSDFTKPAFLLSLLSI